MRRTVAALLALLLVSTVSIAGYHDHGEHDRTKSGACPVCASAHVGVTPAAETIVVEPASDEPSGLASTDSTLFDDPTAARPATRGPPAVN